MGIDPLAAVAALLFWFAGGFTTIKEEYSILTDFFCYFVIFVRTCLYRYQELSNICPWLLLPFLATFLSQCNGQPKPTAPMRLFWSAPPRGKAGMII
jgi:hypothetical protein